MRNVMLFILLVGLTAFQMSPVFAAGENDMAGKMNEEKMAEVMKLATPGENHAKLDPLVGDWQYKSSWWMSPDAAPEISEGTSEAEWILDKRFIQQNVKGKAMGKDFEGIAIIGYDNVKEEYATVWIDNMSTGIMTSSGVYDDSQKTLTENGKFSCPMTGKKDMEVRSITKWIDNDHYMYESFAKDESGNEFKTMSIEYERK